MDASGQQELAQAARAVLPRLSNDAERVSGDLKRLLTHLRAHLLEPGYGQAAFKRRFGGEVVELFAAETGRCIADYLIEARLELAVHLLSGTSVAGERIGHLVGFSDASNFRRSFARHVGMPATGFRRFCRRRAALRPGKPSPASQEHDPLYRRLAETHGRALHQVPPAQRRRWIAQVRFGSPQLFERLSTESRRAGRRERSQGVELAELALRHVEASQPQLGNTYPFQQALALARLGNAHRLAGDLSLAGATFERAWKAWAKARHRDPHVEAEIALHHGGLRLFQGAFPEALELLSRSLALAEEADCPQLQVDARLQRAATHRHAGSPEEMLPDLEAAWRLLESLQADRRRLLGVAQELSLVHLETGSLARAEEHLATARALSEQIDHPPSPHHLDWIEALISKQRGEWQRAEQLLQDARAGLQEKEDVGSVAVISLEIAILWNERGRAREVRQMLVGEILPTLEKLRIHRAALAALQILEEATAASEIPLAVLTRAQALARRIPGQS